MDHSVAPEFGKAAMHIGLQEQVAEGVPFDAHLLVGGLVLVDLTRRIRLFLLNIIYQSSEFGEKSSCLLDPTSKIEAFFRI